MTQAGPRTACYIFLLDGARYDVMRDLLDAGRLPNIHRHIVDPGAFLPAVTTFPSTTGPAHVPFLTGQFAGTSDVLGYRWLDRGLAGAPWFHPMKHRSYNSFGALLFGRDMNQRCVTLYEMFQNPALVLGPVDLCRNKPLRKVTWRRVAAIARGHYTGHWEHIDAVTEHATLAFVDQGCDFIFSVFLAIDEFSHYASPFDERTLASYERADRAIGRVAERLAARGTLERSVLAVVSDHGQSPTGVHIPIVDRVRAHGFAPLYYPRTVRRRFTAAVMESGNSMCMLYVMDGDPTRKIADEVLHEKSEARGLMEELLETPGLPFLATREESGWVRLRGRHGGIRFRREGDAFDLEADGDDLLGGANGAHGGTAPADAPAIPSGRYTDADLFARTLSTRYPDLFAQYWALFQSRRCGDIVLAADDGFDLRLQHERPEHLSSHGSIHREHMMTPVAINVPLRRTEPIRTADVFAIICRACGLQLPHDVPIDGRPVD